MRRTAVFCFSLIVIIGLMLTAGCNPFRITITPSTIEVTVGDPINFSVFKSSLGGDVPYNEAIWELMGDDIGSLTSSTGPTTRVNTDAAGNAQLKASSPDGKVYAIASIYVTYVQIPTSVVIDQSNGWSIKHGDIKTFSAKLLDQYNKQITSATFTWAITNGTGSFSPNPGASTTFTAGDPGTSPDSASVTATYNGGQNPITSPACTGTISRQTPVLTTLTISPSDSFSLEKSKTKSFSATGLDQYGGAITCNPTWSATNTIGTFSPNPSANTTFTATSSGSLPRSGVITAQQTNANGIPITSNSVSGTINDYVPIPTKVVIDQSSGWSIKHGDTKTFSAKIYDQYDVQITSATFTWTITNSTGSFSPNPGASTTFTAGDPGTSPDSASVTATYNGGQNPITSPACTGTISRQTLVLTTLTISPSDSFSLEKSKTKSFSASGLDQYGGAFTCNPTWSATNTIGTFSPNPGANTTFTATSSGSLPRSGVITAQQTNANGIPITSNSVSGTINDYVPIPTKVVIDQSSGWSIKHGDTKTFSAKLYDQYDVQITSATFTWAITNGTGSFSPNPGASTTFTAGDPGTSPDSASVTATYNGGQTPITSPACTGTISRQTPVLTTLTISPSDSFSLEKSKTKSFSATGLDQYGGAITCNPTWSATNTIGTFSPNPGANTTFTATSSGSLPRSGVITAQQTNANGIPITSNSVSGTINDYVPIPTKVVIDQSSGWSMIHGEQKTFDAVLYDQFNAEMPAVSYTWAVSGSNGSFSPNPGSSTTFTAGDPGTSPDSASVTATYGTLTSPACTGTITRQASRPSRVVVSPSLAAVVGKETQDFTAVVYNQYDVVMSGEPVTWSLTGQDIGTLSSSSSNPTTFRAVDFAYGNPDREGAIWAKATNNLSVGDDSKIYALPSRTLNSVSIEPSAITATSKTSSMKATAYDQYGAPFAVDDWTWSTSSYGSLQFLNELTWSGDGTSTSNASLMIGEGISTATYVVKIATATKGSTSKSKTIRIDVPKSFVSSITISPSSASGDLNTSSSFTASAKDQYGYSISTTFSWSVSNSVGSLQYSSSSGSNKITYKKAVSGSITASSNGKTGSATVVGKPLFGTYDNSTWIDVSIPDGQYPNAWGMMKHTVNGVWPKAYITWTDLYFGIRHKYFGDLTYWSTRYYNGSWYDAPIPYVKLSGYLSAPEERHYSISTGRWNNQLANGEFDICVGDDDLDSYKDGAITYFNVVVKWRCDDIW